MSRRYYRQPAARAVSISDLSRVFFKQPDAPDERYFHEDLPQLTNEVLLRERVLLRLALHLTPRPDTWMTERLLRITQEEGRRRGH